MNSIRCRRAGGALSALLAACATPRTEPAVPRELPPILVRVRERVAEGTGDAAALRTAPLPEARLEWDGGEAAPDAEGLARVPGVAAGKRLRVTAEGRRPAEATLPTTGGLDLVLDTPAALSALGRAAELVGMDDAAARSWDDALALDPQQADAAAGQARMRAYRAVREGQIESLSLLLRAAEAGGDGRLYFTAALTGLEQGRFDLALKYAGLCAAREDCPGDAAFLTGVAALFTARGVGIESAYHAARAMAIGKPELPAEGAEFLAKALEDACKRRRDLCDLSRPDAAAVRARALMRPATAADAERLLRGALAAAPREGELHFLLGQALALRGQSKDADRAFQDAVESAGSPTPAWLAHALLALGENTLALTGKGSAAHPFFENAVRSSGRHPGILLHAGMAFERAGQMESAESLYRWVTEGPAGPESAAAQALLAGMTPPAAAAPGAPAGAVADAEPAWCEAAIEGLGKPRSRDRKAVERVETLGARLAEQVDAPATRWVVVESDEVNAFAVPGGCVVVSDGLLEQLDRSAQKPDLALAAVLAHELSHLTRRHLAVRLRAAWLGGVRGGALADEVPSPSAAAAALARVRAEEAEADTATVYTLMRAGYDPAAALAAFETLVESGPSGRGAFAAGFARPTGPARFQRVRGELWRIVGANAGYEQGLRVLASLSRETQDALSPLETAISGFTEMAFLLPRAPEVHRNLGVAYLMASRRGRAPDQWRLHLQPDPRAFAAEATPKAAGDVRALTSEQLLARAAMSLARSLYLRPDYPFAHATLAAVLAEQWKVDSALVEVRAALSGGEGHAWIWNVGGILAAMRNEAEVAEAAFERAIETDPRQAPALYNLALFYTRAGNAPAARAAWSRYLALNEGGSWQEYGEKQVQALGPPPAPVNP